ncbi:MAG TPA: VOC family protein [Rhodanobacteraceae bacterium]
MKLESVWLIAADVKAMVAFYEMVTGSVAEWLGPQFAEIVTPGAALGIGSTAIVSAFREGSAQPAANRTAIVVFMVDDVDAAFARIRDKVDVIHEPKTMPWGNRTAQFRDPEGTAVALFTPATDAARKRYAGR